MDREVAIMTRFPYLRGFRIEEELEEEYLYEIPVIKPLKTFDFNVPVTFFLDEPEAALSPSRQFALLARIHELALENCQFIIATHSPILISCPGSEVYALTEGGVELTPYQETEHFSLMKHFVNNPEHMLHYLFEEGEA